MTVQSLVISIPIPSQSLANISSKLGTFSNSDRVMKDGVDEMAEISGNALKNVPQLILYYFPETKSLQFVLKQNANGASTVQTIQMQFRSKLASPLSDNDSKNVAVYKKTDSKLPGHITTLLASVVAGSKEDIDEHEVNFVTGWFVGNFQWDINEEYWIGWMGAVKKYFAQKIQQGLFRRND